jgi:hypothetical protein
MLSHPREHRQTDRFCKLPDAKPLHHSRAMYLDRPHAEAEIVRYDLVRSSRDQRIENLTLTPAETSDPIRRCLSLGVAMGPNGCQRRFDRAQQFFVGEGLLDEIESSTFHRLHCGCHVSTAGDDYHRQVNSEVMEPSLKLEPVDVGQAYID